MPRALSLFLLAAMIAPLSAQSVHDTAQQPAKCTKCATFKTAKFERIGIDWDFEVDSNEVDGTSEQNEVSIEIAVDCDVPFLSALPVVGHIFTSDKETRPAEIVIVANDEVPGCCAEKQCADKCCAEQVANQSSCDTKKCCDKKECCDGKTCPASSKQPCCKNGMVEYTIIHEESPPILKNIPYVNRLFKNVGIEVVQAPCEQCADGPKNPTCPSGELAQIQIGTKYVDPYYGGSDANEVAAPPVLSEPTMVHVGYPHGNKPCPNCPCSPAEKPCPSLPSVQLTSHAEIVAEHAEEASKWREEMLHEMVEMRVENARLEVELEAMERAMEHMEETFELRLENEMLKAKIKQLESSKAQSNAALQIYRPATPVAQPRVTVGAVHAAKARLTRPSTKATPAVTVTPNFLPASAIIKRPAHAAVYTGKHPSPEELQRVTEHIQALHRKLDQNEKKCPAQKDCKKETAK